MSETRGEPGQSLFKVQADIWPSVTGDPFSFKSVFLFKLYHF